MKKPLFSKYKISIPLLQKSTAISLIIKHNLPTTKTFVGTERRLEIVIKKRHLNLFKNLFEKENINAEYCEIIGHFNTLEGLRGRYGLILGFAFLLFMLFYSSRVVWKIEISGLQHLSEDEVISQLEEAGFTLGTYIPSVDYDALHNTVLKNSDNLSWISVNVTGNVAYVEIKETKSPQANNTPTYTNIVAAFDGYIESVKVIQGKKVVTMGDVVKKGDILISGVINSQAEGVRYEQAKGEVYAYVNKSIFVKVPYVSTKKAYTGKKFTDKTYKIYNFPINFLSKYGNQTSLYDTIEKKEKLSFLGISHIPIEIQTTVYYEYEIVTVELSVSEAVDLAFVQLREELDKNLQSSELIDKSVKTYHDSEAFYIECQLYCLENIAKEQAFFVTK